MAAPIHPPTEEALAEAARSLERGALVAFPTETVYGLGADATNGEAVARIFAVKRRPRFNPLILHVSGLAQACEHGAISPLAERLAKAFWPGPLTLILPRLAGATASLLASAGLDTIAVRAPDHPVAQALIGRLARPIAAPSANRSGRLSPTSAGDVAAELGADIAMILDGGRCRHGIESTIIDLSGERPVLLRPGAIAREDIEAQIGRLAAPRSDVVVAPGMMASHYAPGLPLRLNATSVEPGEALLAFGASLPSSAARALNLSSAGDLAEAAANLFAFLRALDAPPARRIAVMPIPESGLGEAINDRLKRAAAPR